MLRALVWKEWRQLRALRWAGIGLGALLPLAFLAGAEASRRGLSPLGRIGAYSSRELFLDLLPSVLAFALWPLVALLVTAQAFCGDRAAGTEWFLLERPVPRRRIWTARLAASAGSLLVVALATTAIWLALAAVSGALDSNVASSVGELRWGSAVTVLAFLSGIAGATLARSPLAAVLLGGLLAAIPSVIAIQLSALFPRAAIGMYPVGMMVPWLLVPAYAVASLVASSQGEPAGRGRFKRAAITLGVALAFTAVTFVVAAPAAQRLDHRLMGWFGLSVPPLGGTGTLTAGWRSGMRVVDLESTGSLRFLPPPIEGTWWKPDGTTLAVLTSSGALGSVKENLRLDFYDRRGQTAAPSLELPAELLGYDAAWAGRFLVLAAARPEMKGASIWIADPEGHSLRSTGFALRAPFLARLTGPTERGEVFLLLYDERFAGSVFFQTPGPLAFGLHRIDPEAARVDPEPLITDEGRITRVDFGGAQVVRKLSPSGRYWIRNKRQDGGWRRVVVEIATGREILEPQPTRGAVWLAGDRLMWLERRGPLTRLATALPGEAARPLREWVDARIVLEPSTDGSMVLVRTRKTDEGEPAPRIEREPLDEPAPLTEGVVEQGRVGEARVYDVAADRWLDLEPPDPSGTMNEHYEIASSWAGPRTLVQRGPGWIGLVDVDRPDRVRYLVGSP